MCVARDFECEHLFFLTLLSVLPMFVCFANAYTCTPPRPPPTHTHHTAGTDKKTSVLDYVIKSLYDHNEESVLVLLEDLSLVEETARLSGTSVCACVCNVVVALCSSYCDCPVLCDCAVL